MNKDYKSINNLWKDSEGYRYFGTLKLSSKIKYDGDDFIPLWEWINQLQKESKRLKDNWNELKEYIDIKLYNMEYLQKLCGCRLDDEIHIILDIIKKEMKELEGSDSNE